MLFSAIASTLGALIVISVALGAILIAVASTLGVMLTSSAFTLYAMLITIASTLGARTASARWPVIPAGHSRRPPHAHASPRVPDRSPSDRRRAPCCVRRS